MKRALIFALAFAAAAAATAQLSKYKDWVKSPEAYFLTTSERAEWANLRTDADAEKFIATYWARRGGDKFQAEIARRVAAADQTFKLRRQRGAESVRGHLLIMLGTPSRVSTTRPQQEGGGASGDTGLNVRPDGSTTGLVGATGSTSAAIQSWTYSKERLDPSWGVPELVARVVVDPARGADELQNRAEVERVLAAAAEKSVINPAAAASAPPAGAPAAGTTGAPPAAGTSSSAPAAPASAAAPPPPPPAPAASLPAATRSVLESAAKAGADSPGFFGGTFHSVPGDSFYAVELAVPSEKAAGGAKFAALVTSESGAEAASVYEDAALIDTKAGARTQKLCQRSIVLPPGSYKGSFALVSPDGATALATGNSSFQVPAKSSVFEVSPLILASTLTPLSKRPGATDPFVFGVEKPIRVDPQPGRVFAKDESLWYFYAVANPAIAAGSAPAAAPAATPAPGAPAAAAPAEPKPRLMTRISVLKDGEDAFKPTTMPAEMQPLAPGYFATGTEIPLKDFEPGFYTFAINVRDLNAPRDSVAFKGIDRKQDFIVLKADGSMPDRKAPAAPAKPKPPKK